MDLDGLTIRRREDLERTGNWLLARRSLGLSAFGMNLVEIPPGERIPEHDETERDQEEVFVVLEGEGELLLMAQGKEPSSEPVRPGSVVVRPPATRVSHAFRGGPDGITLLAFGSREPNDIAYYPRSGKVSLRGIGAMFRVERLGYWDGEPG